MDSALVETRNATRSSTLLAPCTSSSRLVAVLLASKHRSSSESFSRYVTELSYALAEADELCTGQYEQVDVQVVATKSSLHFYDWRALEEEHGGRVKVWTDAEEWEVRSAGATTLGFSC